MFLLSIAAITLGCQTPDFKSLYQDLKPGIVKVFTKEAKDKPFVFAGTGWFYKNNLTVVTAKHVAQVRRAQKSYAIQIKLIDQRVIPVTEVDGMDDVSVLKLKENSVPAKLMDLSTKSVEVADVVFKLGYPGLFMDALEPLVGTGMVNQYATIAVRGGLPEYRIGHTIPLNGGDSGCPLFNKEGKVVGMNVSGSQDSNVFNFAVPLEKLKQELDKLTE